MNNCRRLTRHEARIIRNIADVPANRYHPGYYGREVPHMTLPGKVTAWCDSPAANQTELDRLLAHVSPYLLGIMLVVGAVYVALAWVISLGK